MFVGVTQAAAELGVSPRRVRALIDAGALTAKKVSGSYVIDQSVLDAVVRRHRPAHVRAFSPRVAWAAAAAVDGVQLVGIGPDELSRLRRRLDKAGPEPGPWQARLAGLARQRLQVRIGPAQLERLLDDPRVTRGGPSAVPTSGPDPLIGPGRPAIWVRSEDELGVLRRTYGLLPAVDGNLDIAVAGAPELPALGVRSRDAYRLAVVTDLLAGPDARSHRAGRDLLTLALHERNWRALPRSSR